MSKLILQGNVITNRKIIPDQIVVCEEGRFTYVGPIGKDVPDVIVKNGYIAPGYIDIHVHGSNGYDVMDNTADSLVGMANSLASYGVTSFMATTLTAEIDLLERVLQNCNRVAYSDYDGARLVGVHLEGPWINSRYKGAQNEAYIIPPTVEDARRLKEAAGGLLRVVTLAPENEDFYMVIPFLRENGIKVSVGHSDASFDVITESIKNGLSHVTHCFNAMRPLHHREPGVVGAALYHDELTTELIADGVHVHPAIMSIMYRLKNPNKMVLVSDGIQAVGLPDGEYNLGGLPVHLNNGKACLADGTLAGSTLTLDLAVRNMVELCHVPIPDAISMASETPARIIGLGRSKGKIEHGYDADFIVMDEDLHVMETYVGGRKIYSAAY